MTKKQKTVQKLSEGRGPGRGRKMRSGAGWRLLNPSGQAVFSGTLLGTFTLSGQRVALFSVPVRRRGEG